MKCLRSYAAEVADTDVQPARGSEAWTRRADIRRLQEPKRGAATKRKTAHDNFPETSTIRCTLVLRTPEQRRHHVRTSTATLGCRVGMVLVRSHVLNGSDDAGASHRGKLPGAHWREGASMRLQSSMTVLVWVHLPGDLFVHLHTSADCRASQRRRPLRPPVKREDATLPKHDGELLGHAPSRQRCTRSSGPCCLGDSGPEMSGSVHSRQQLGERRLAWRVHREQSICVRPKVKQDQAGPASNEPHHSILLEKALHGGHGRRFEESVESLLKARAGALF